MKLPIFLILAALFGCQSKKTTLSSPEQEALAIITGNSLPVDGCEESVRIESEGSSTPLIQYKPTASSLPILQNALSSIPAEQRYSAQKPVRIRFYKTGRQVALECGWGSRPQVDEIEILSISDR
ncbi:hypothetical protein GCM10027341_13710 [Spirosoma knui]